MVERELKLDLRITAIWIRRYALIPLSRRTGMSSDDLTETLVVAEIRQAIWHKLSSNRQRLITAVTVYAVRQHAWREGWR